MISERPAIERRIDRWKECLCSYVAIYGNSDVDHSVRIRHATPQLNALAEMFEEIKTRSKFKGGWKDQTVMVWGRGARILQKPTKTHEEYSLSLYDGRLGMDAHLAFTNLIRNMTDEFWIELAKLCEETSVKWFTNQYPRDYDKNPVNKELYKHSKSVVFSLLRNSIVADQLKDESGGIGFFEWQWSVEGDWQAMLNEAAIAVRRVNRLNYHLWRWYYQTSYRWLKEFAKKNGHDFKTLLKQRFPED